VGDLSDGVLDASSVEPDTQFEDPATEPPVQSTNGSPRPMPELEPADPKGPAQREPDEGAAMTVELLSAVQRVERQIAVFHARAENYEQLIGQMQSRIEQLQGDQVQALLRPIIQRFASLHAQAAAAAEQAHERGEAAEKDFDFFAVAIEEAFGLVDIESVAARPSVEFDSSKHHAASVVVTDDPGLDRRIQRVLRQGFSYAGASRVFLPAQVSIYRYEPPTDSVTVSEEEQSPAAKPGEGASGD
jgi:molecular chaperone GrpE (heat shock protein)